MTTVEITLPDEIAKRAQAMGLLSDQAIEKLFREAIERKQGVGELFVAMDRMAAIDGEPMTEEEIQAEIDAARAERRARSR